MSDVEKQITELISEYKFPRVVLDDVNKRLTDCPGNDAHAAQQLRFLRNVVAAGHAIKRERSEPK